MALACNPKVLIADEPTTALDVMVQAQILELLDGLCRDFGLALILVTHDLPVVAQLCNRCAVMYAGEIVERGPLEAIYHTPGHPYSRMLFAASPDLAGLDEPVLSIPGAPPRLDRPIDGCPFSPRCDSVFDACTRSAAARAARSRITTPPATSTRGCRRERASRRCSRSRTSSSATRSTAASSGRPRASRAAACMPSRACRCRCSGERCSPSSASRAAARRRPRRPCCGSSIPSPARSASTVATSCRSARASCVHSAAGSRSSTRIRTSRSTRGSASVRRSRSRS